LWGMQKEGGVMRRLLLLALVGAVVLGIGAIKGSPKTHYAIVEYSKIAGGGTVVNVVVYDAIDHAKVDVMVEYQLRLFVEMYKPQEDVLAFGWDGTQDLERKINDNLVYVVAEKKIIKGEEYMARFPPRKKKN
jgi:hypothetical protein